MMGRKSLLKKLYEETTDRPDTGETWLIIYDFKGKKPNPRFWSGLNELISILDDAERIQYSVMKTKSRKGAVTAVKLARHYGAEVKVFMGEEATLI